MSEQGSLFDGWTDGDIPPIPDKWKLLPGKWRQTSGIWQLTPGGRLWRDCYRAYLIEVGGREAGCLKFELNPNWDGKLKANPRARIKDPYSSQDAAANIKEVDLFGMKRAVDALIESNRFAFSTGARAWLMDNGYDVDRGESVRRRFSDLCFNWDYVHVKSEPR
jgi:hypothetical protein